MTLLFWLLLGQIGAWLIWLLWQLDFEERVSCPTPRAIAGSIVFSVLGPIGLFLAISLWAVARPLFMFYQWLKTKPVADWWKTSICQRKGN